MQIIDEELLQVFQAEATERLDRMERALLSLEQNHNDKGLIDEFFRDAHSLKGVARLIEQKELEDLSHQLEDEFDKIKSGKVQITEEKVTSLTEILDQLRFFAQQVIEDQKREQEHRSEEVDSLFSQERLSTYSQSNEFRFETVRVETAKLDSLLQQAGELAVAQVRLKERITHLEHIKLQFEEFANKKLTYGSEKEEKAMANKKLALWSQELNETYKHLDNDCERLNWISQQIGDEVSRMRLMPLSFLFEQYHRMVRDLGKSQNKKIKLRTEGEDILVDKFIIEQLKDPLIHLVRNAIDHGIESPEKRLEQGKEAEATLLLKAKQTSTHVLIQVIDDGNGVNEECVSSKALALSLYTKEEMATMSKQQIQMLIFETGFSTRADVSNLSGRGIGLDVVKSRIESLKGSISLQSERGKGSLFQLRLPVSLMTTSIIVVRVGPYYYGIPSEDVTALHFFHVNDVFHTEGREAITYQGKPLSIKAMLDLLELPEENPIETKQIERYSAIIVSNGEEKVALAVDEFVTESQVIVKPFSSLLKRIRNVMGVTILGTGITCIVLNPYDIVKSVQKEKIKSFNVKKPSSEKKRNHILLVEDSITTRVQVKRILESQDFVVTTAVDGAEAWHLLQENSFHALVTDVEMPNMDGFTLTEKIRKNSKLNQMPVVLLTSLIKESEKKKGVTVGADAYLTKSTFDQDVLIGTLHRLL
ncbi:response regulator [Heliorestis acidaminivorans]|uniref:Stage 0 sporulation protein A homolog n=1 Tax=Heliorestis acidaminivorans TaxID=553427 RepID=A0A6I0F6U3_9FIRM|nr:response regulator [Heliorestis acidaminivorans]KAB2954557.1 response regulator [Heliorestis acidaminivorans]